MMEIPTWLFVLLALAVVVEGVMLYTNLREHRFRVRVPQELTRLEQALPSLVGLTGAAISDGNRVEVLQNGDGFFPRFLADIAAAEQSVNLESYVWWRGEICREVARALADRARAGVKVRVMLDALGSFTMERELRPFMRRAGCRVEIYNRLRPRNLGILNKRSHRKLAVFDGRVAHVFGHGIAHQWTGNGEDEMHWRDTGVRLEGPVANSVQSVFCEHWVEQTGEVLIGERYFPALKPVGKLKVQVFSGSPKGGVSDFELMFHLVIATAQQELIIQNPYFIPDTDVCVLMARAVARGVAVKVMVPGPYIDSRLVRHAGHHSYEKLLAAGVEMFEHRRTLTHQKVMIVDGLWSHVGSTNLDDRSFDINEEAGVGITDAGIAAELKAAFEADLAHCIQLRHSDLANRRIWHRAFDLLCYQVAGQL
jgi:cardiolipin synthase